MMSERPLPPGAWSMDILRTDGSPFVGFAVRALCRIGRKYIEVIYVEADPDDLSDMEAPPGGEVRVLSVTPLVLEAETGPVLVIDRILPHRFDRPAAWIDRVLADVIPGEVTEDRQSAPMPDGEFWSYIDLLDGEVSDDGLTRLVDALSDRPHPEVVAFRDALWLKLRALDHPLNTVRIGDHVSADASLYYRCEIVAAGKRVHAAAIANPREGGEMDGSAGEGLLSVAEHAALEDMPAAEVEIETGRNGRFWPAAPPGRFPWMDIPSLGAFSPYILCGVRDELSLRLRFTSFVAYASGSDGHVRELMGCLMAGSFGNAREELLPFLLAHLSPDEALDDRLIIWQSGMMRPQQAVSLSGLSRRSRLSMDEYVDLYYNGVL